MDLDAVTARVRDDVSASEAVDPIAVRFLLSQYAATGCDELAAVVGAALGRALDQPDTADERVEWLLLFADAADWSDDERLRATVARLLAASDTGTPAAIEAVLRASTTIGDGARLGSAVDDLERLIGRGYEPGDGVASADPFAVASALLTAFDVTGRLPYAMLAEELVQTALRRHETTADPVGDAASACRAAGVLCRLAALHADAEYVQAAVITPGADYRADGARLLTAHVARALDTTRAAALYGLALAQWLGLH